MSKTILQLKDIAKYFPGIKALDKVDFTIRTGEVHALIGENGAGKSTLVKIMTGVYQPTKGKILMENGEVQFKTSHDAQAAGVVAIHQEASMFSELTVTENIFMGHHMRKKSGILDWKAMREHTSELLGRMELDINPDTLIKNLGTAQRHMVEIAKALSVDAQLVIMDEPTSALSLKEVDELYKIIRQLKEQGKAIVFISHKFDEIFAICDYFTVFRDGQYIGEGKVKESTVDDIVKMMVGRSLNQMFPKKEANIGEKILEIKNLSLPGYFKDVSFTLHKGEILGFFGLVGAGRSEVMRTVFGIDKKSEGTILLNGKEIHISSPRVAMSHGIAYVPEDRQQQGAILEMSLSHNITLPQIDRLSKFGILRKDSEKTVTEEFGNKMEIKAANWKVNANTLSGGNQQKVVLAKWLATNPEILILDEPTKGIDVATKAAVHEFVSEMASSGLAVILVSSEMPEILGMADRTVVMHEGRVSRVFSREEANSDNMILAATGHEEGTL
ncbi:sugar ABC transporter ATP-binding protein [Oceanispirochaeta crateris]|uniref:Sugar ABC transporter ATP-binding protein n=1 Tax=Oceanispirochaeta crateris TaxID=2518645 RepID=A0A5C1QN31_9SPIO|nr:sugar ABC transporter ATP-binding protein [Oceanispirochaeta crateris]QEN09505.1 sugar ABC transporter ATP-binding protein [Oceanispirochaeta crateris]